MHICSLYDGKDATNKSPLVAYSNWHTLANGMFWRVGITNEQKKTNKKP